MAVQSIISVVEPLKAANGTSVFHFDRSEDGDALRCTMNGNSAGELTLSAIDGELFLLAVRNRDLDVDVTLHLDFDNIVALKRALILATAVR